MTSAEANQVLARDPNDAVRATRQEFEDAGFQVRYTPTVRDSDHHTVILPRPMTEESVESFNAILGRTRKK